MENKELNQKMKNFSLLTLRVLISIMMLKHGIEKLGHLQQEKINFPAVLIFSPYVGLLITFLIETICSLGVIIGLYIRINALLISLCMFVAGFIFHDPISDFKNAELAIIYCIIFAFIAVIGGGNYIIKKNKK